MKEMERTMKTMEVAPPLYLVVATMVVPKISATPSLRYTNTFSYCSSIYVWDFARELGLGYESFGFWLNLGFFNDKVHLELKSSAYKWKESIKFVLRVFGWFEVHRQHTKLGGTRGLKGMVGRLSIAMVVLLMYHIIQYNLLFIVFYMHSFATHHFHHDVINHFSQNRVHTNLKCILCEL
jgi:hypothetical protein